MNKHCNQIDSPCHKICYNRNLTNNLALWGPRGPSSNFYKTCIVYSCNNPFLVWNDLKSRSRKGCLLNCIVLLLEAIDTMSFNSVYFHFFLPVLFPVSLLLYSSTYDAERDRDFFFSNKNVCTQSMKLVSWQLCAWNQPVYYYFPIRFVIHRYLNKWKRALNKWSVIIVYGIGSTQKENSVG